MQMSEKFFYFCVVYGRPLRIDILIEINNERIVAVPEE